VSRRELPPIPRTTRGGILRDDAHPARLTLGARREAGRLDDDAAFAGVLDGGVSMKAGSVKLGVGVGSALSCAVVPTTRIATDRASSMA